MIKVSSLGREIYSRFSGANIKKSIYRDIKHKGYAEIDLSGVTHISHAFADEAFASIITSDGYDFLKKHVKFTNGKNSVNNIIAKAILVRVEDITKH